MDVRSLAASTPLTQPTASRRSGLDVTISDKGIADGGTSTPAAVSRPTPQVASGPETQQVLSDAEAVALEREFAFLQQERAQGAGRVAVYNQHGTKSLIQSDPRGQGGLLDLVG